MLLSLLERNGAEEFELTPDDLTGLDAVNGGAGVRWVTSFPRADTRKTYGLDETADPDEQPRWG